MKTVLFINYENASVYKMTLSETELDIVQKLIDRDIISGSWEIETFDQISEI